MNGATALFKVAPKLFPCMVERFPQMYRGQSDWEAIAQAAVSIRKHGILAIGNGDIKSLTDAHQRIQSTGVNGVLIGRGALGYPWIFQEIEQVRKALATESPLELNTEEPSLDEKFQAMIKHAECFEAINGLGRFVRMRKHLGWYCSSFPHAAAMRAQMVRTNGTQDVKNILESYLKEQVVAEASALASTPA